MRSLLLSLAVFVVGAHSAASILGSESSKAVPNSYIVVLKPSLPESKRSSHLDWADGVLKSRSVSAKSTFAFKGFNGYVLKASKAVALELAESDEVDFIEADQVISLPTTPTPTRPRVGRLVQTNAPWGLARISHHLPGSSQYVYEQTFNVFSYILDTGINVANVEFQGNAQWGANFANDGQNTDGSGHGTRLAAIVSSKTFGVARFARLIAVKILDSSGSGTVSGVIAGINWSVNDMTVNNRVGKSTALLAAGGAFSTALNNAITAASTSGLFFALPAGDDNTQANTPAAGCTAGATTIADARAPFSNWGPNIDIWAPGTNILSLGVTNSGTGNAAAHIAGLGVYFLSLEGPRTPAQLCARLQQVATPNILTGIPSGTVNLLAYNLSGL